MAGREVDPAANHPGMEFRGERRRAMEVLIENSGYRLGNVGDVAMLQVACRRLREYWPEVELAVITEAGDRLARYCPGVTPCDAASARQWHEKWNVLGSMHRLVPRAAHAGLQGVESGLRGRFPGWCEPWVRWRLERRGAGVVFDRFLEQTRKSTAVVATGGGYITDAFEGHAVGLLETLDAVLRQGKPVALFGQGIGPIASPRLRKVAAAVLPRVNLVALREGRRGPALLRDLGVPENRVVVTGDDAIELAANSGDSRMRDAIGFNLRIAEYSGVGDDEAATILGIVNELVHKHGSPVVPVPISWHDGDSDVATLERAMRLSDAERAILEAADTPEAVVKQVGRCRIVVTGSYHAGVFALSQGIPVVGIAKSAYYEDKFLGLREQFGTGCDAVLLDAPDWKGTLKQKLEQAWENADEQRPLLREAAARQISASRAAYDRFVQLVGEIDYE